MTTVTIIYGIIALVCFLIFFCPVFPDWEDYTKTEVCKCAGFAFFISVLWPAAALLLFLLAVCGAYYAKTTEKDGEDDD